MILETFPTPIEFYKTYWGKKPFIVRNYIPSKVIDSFIDGDILAGFALEEDIKSRIITNNQEGNDWVCEHGPFDEKRFGELDDKNWSLLVQNVEQYHTDTAQLLSYFQSSPRWLIDDIMVSYSAPGGSVGPHTDSYHTFLVQGLGKREWKISSELISDDCYADNLEMKVLQNGFDGEVYEVTAGDVIYMPPFFGHEGKTIEAAMTFSVGFLGPKLSEILGEYAHYLEANEALDQRYLGHNLGVDSEGFSISVSTQDAVKSRVNEAIASDQFSSWMASYFSMPTHVDIDGIEVPYKKLSSNDILSCLTNGQKIYRPEYVKLVILPSKKEGFFVSVYGEVITVPEKGRGLVEALNRGDTISSSFVDEFIEKDMVLLVLSQLYNLGALSID